MSRRQIKLYNLITTAMGNKRSRERLDLRTLVVALHTSKTSRPISPPSIFQQGNQQRFRFEICIQRWLHRCSRCKLKWWEIRTQLFVRFSRLQLHRPATVVGILQHPVQLGETGLTYHSYTHRRFHISEVPAGQHPNGQQSFCKDRKSSWVIVRRTNSNNLVVLIFLFRCFGGAKIMA